MKPRSKYIAIALIGFVIVGYALFSVVKNKTARVPQLLPDLFVESANTGNPTDVVIKNIGTAPVGAEMFWVCSFIGPNPHQCYRVRDVVAPGSQAVLNFDGTPSTSFRVIVDKAFLEDPGLVTELHEDNNQAIVDKNK